MSFASARAELAFHTCRLKKHQGELWSYVLDTDEDYCRWALQNVEEDERFFPEAVRDALMEILGE